MVQFRQYEILEHTGDAKIRAFGKTKEELFLNAMRGMFELVGPKRIKNEKVKRTIKIASSDYDALLVDFLSEVNYLMQTEREAYDDIKLKKFSDAELEVELLGQPVEGFDEEIKAVTYHGLQIKKNKEGLWEATIILDI